MSYPLEADVYAFGIAMLKVGFPEAWSQATSAAVVMPHNAMEQRYGDAQTLFRTLTASKVYGQDALFRLLARLVQPGFNSQKEMSHSRQMATIQASHLVKTNPINTAVWH